MFQNGYKKRYKNLQNWDFSINVLRCFHTILIISNFVIIIVEFNRMLLVWILFIRHLNCWMLFQLKCETKFNNNGTKIYWFIIMVNEKYWFLIIIDMS